MGGTCAIYFGLKNNATHIFAGACQYNIGSFVHREDHEHIFKAMMGENAGQAEADLLNAIMPNLLEENKNCKSIIHLLYSKGELTYQRQIIDLLNKLHECNISVIETVEFFSNHSDVGIYFTPFLSKEVNKLL